MQSGKLDQNELRMRAIEAAATVAASNDDIGNLLVLAEWIASYVTTGRLPEIESEQLAVAGRRMETA